MDIWRSVNGIVDIELTAADPATALAEMNRQLIPLYDVIYLDEITVRFAVQRQDLKKVEVITEKRGDAIQVCSRRGIFWTWKGLLRRPILLIGVALLCIFSLLIPSRVFFVQVEGNESVPSKLILEQASLCGIRFGASRRAVRSEKMKNELLQAIPDLQWAGINTSGCVATITVKERQTGAGAKDSPEVSSIAAVRDGVILSCTVTSGNPLCKVGQQVKAGDILVSGYTDCGLSIRATRAQAEILASTNRDLTVIYPAKWVCRRDTHRQVRKYALIFGKNRINLYFDSGISVPSCGRMYEENYMALPGGFILPVALVTEVWTYYETESESLPEDVIFQSVKHLAQRYVAEQMMAGRIVTAEESWETADGIYVMSGHYSCQEMIGCEFSEEIVTPNGEND